jgi:hypothetical protein
LNGELFGLQIYLILLKSVKNLKIQKILMNLVFFCLQVIRAAPQMPQMSRHPHANILLKKCLQIRRLVLQLSNNTKQYREQNSLLRS